jgi:proteasome lid subunit RPN8/RPN11
MPGRPLQRLLLSRSVLEQMQAQALAERPLECCGLLAGVIDADGTGLVQERYPLPNEAASPVEFISEGRAMFAADRDMRRRQLEVLAVYHSHPSSPPVPSPTDLECSRWSYPDVVWLIISLRSDPAEVRGWWLTEKEYRPAEWRVVEEMPGERGV